jgi:uncharacterized membrane protein
MRFEIRLAAVALAVSLAGVAAGAATEYAER